MQNGKIEYPPAVPAGRLYGCPVELTLNLVGGKWKTIIIARLKGERLRYGEIRKAIPDLADKVLTQRLRELEKTGFLRREDSAGSTRYLLTPLGESLAPALEQLYNWGQEQGRLAGVRFRTTAETSPPEPRQASEPPNEHWRLSWGG